MPLYSHVLAEDGAREVNLTATLSVRNTDPETPITITSVRYFDTAGTLVRHYVERPLRLSPLASAPFVVAEGDRAGGVGSSFVVEWEAPTEVSPPIIEAVMISTRGAQGISFVSRGHVVRPLEEGAEEEELEE